MSPAAPVRIRAASERWAATRFAGRRFRDFDMALIKDTPFGHRGKGELGIVEFRAEFFNIFNIVNFGLPANTVRGTGFGTDQPDGGTIAADSVFAEIDLLKTLRSAER